MRDHKYTKYSINKNIMEKNKEIFTRNIMLMDISLSQLHNLYENPLIADKNRGTRKYS